MKIFIYTFIAVVFVTTISGSTVEAAVNPPACPYTESEGSYVVNFPLKQLLARTPSRAHTEHVNVNIPSGKYDLSMYSYDNHSDHPGQNQVDEKWRVGFYVNNVLVANSPASADIETALEVSSVTHRNVEVPANVTSVLAYHFNYNSSNYESVYPICVKFESKAVPLTGTCSVSDTSVKKGEGVTFTANADGGTSPYTYKWSNGLTDTTRVVNWTATSNIAPKVTITDKNGQTKLVSCNTVVVEQPPVIISPEVTCTASPSTVYVGENVTFRSNVAAGSSNQIIYTWSGDASGTRSTSYKTFNTPGTYTAAVRITDGNRKTATDQCSVIVERRDDPITSPRVTCSASPSTVYVGENVTFQSNVTPGSSNNITYLWSGDASGTQTTSNKTFNTPGTHIAFVKVTDGNGRMSTDSCSVRVVEENTPTPNNIRVSCNVSDTSVDEDDRVTFTANVTGADGAVDYDWSGDVNEDSRSFSYRVNDEDIRATVRVTDSAGNTTSDSCSTVRVEEKTDDLRVTCEVSDRRAEDGDRITFEAKVRGGAGSLDYDWRGDVDGDDRRETVRVDSEDGDIKASIRVRDRDGNTDTDTCDTVRVEEERGSVLGASIINPPAGNFSAVDSVFLSQVPYTGPEEVAKGIAYALGLLAWSAFLAMVFIKRRNAKLQTSRVEAFKAHNIASRG